MVCNQAAVGEHLQVVVQDGPMTIPSSWNDAESLQTHLHKRNIGSTIHLDPSRREAHLEVWPGSTADQVQAALDCWQACTEA
jgi:hypothetical protein